MKSLFFLPATHKEFLIHQVVLMSYCFLVNSVPHSWCINFIMVERPLDLLLPPYSKSGASYRPLPAVYTFCIPNQRLNKLFWVTITTNYLCISICYLSRLLPQGMCSSTILSLFILTIFCYFIFIIVFLCSLYQEYCSSSLSQLFFPQSLSLYILTF